MTKRQSYMVKSPKNERKRAEREAEAEAIASGRAKVYTRQCLYPPCGHTFQTTNPFERYCSNDCRRTWQNWDTLVHMKTCIRHAERAEAEMAQAQRDPLAGDMYYA